MEDERFDAVLMEVAGQCGGIQPLLDTIFAFLYRRTDFFHVMREGDKIGFPPGVAEKLVMRGFKQYEQMAIAARQQAEQQAQSKPPNKPPSEPPSEPARSKPARSDPAPAEPAVPAAREEKAASAPQPARAEPAASASAPAGAPSTASSRTACKKSVAHLAEDKPYNGGRAEGYSWEQTLHDVTIVAPVPAGTRARDVVCVISKTHLSLKLRGAEKPIIDGEFPCDARNNQTVWEKVRADESYWNVGEVDGVLAVTVYLEKDREAWWKSAIEGDAGIDTTKVDSTRSMYEYDDETQGAIRKIMFDQEQKRKGLPTSDELKNEDMLRKAWDAEGSPFKGTPFDPSMINFNGSGDGSGAMPPGMEGLPGGLPPLPGAAAEEDEEPRIQEVDG